mgnify:CR=1 FL=1
MARIIDKEEKRCDIALAAMDIFCEKGIALTTIDDIAKSAGVAKGTIYLYFKNKEEIIFAIWDKIFTLHIETFERSIKPTMRAKDKILTFFHFSAFEEKSSDIMRLYHHFVSAMLVDTTGLYAAYFEQFFQQDYDLILSCLKEGVASGEFKEVDVHLLTQSIVFAIKGVLIKSKANDLNFDEMQKLLTTQITFLLENFTREIA